MQKARELTIGAAAGMMRKGTLSARMLVESCFERIHQREDTVRAWVEIYEKQALEEALSCDRESGKGQWRGRLHGIPMGIKDIMHVKGMWTRAGCPVYPARVAEADAQAVSRLRAEGAIILGKTVTTPFAANDPSDTRNPWNPGHTPGGSSSGSGAAVADRMCLAALGTQTGGSVLRPAAYNGVVGFKPTYGEISMEGIIPLSWSQDHVGALARCVEDAGILWRVMRDDLFSPFARAPRNVRMPEKSLHSFPPRLGHIREFFDSGTSPEVVEHLASLREKFVTAGAGVVDLKLPDSFGDVPGAWEAILQTEAASYHRTLFQSSSDRYPPRIKARIEKGFKVPGYEYVEYLHKRIDFQKQMMEVLSAVDAAFMPTAHTTAPGGLGSTGSAAFTSPWSFAGFPSLSIPSGLDGNGLPLAVQLVGAPGAEERLLEVGSWCERLIGFNHSPESEGLA